MSESIDTSANTTIDAFQDYFGLSVELEDFENMTYDEIVAYCQQLLIQYDTVDADAFMTDLLEDLGEISSELNSIIGGLYDVMDDGGLTDDYLDTLEALAENLQDLEDLADGSEDIADAFSDAQEDIEEWFFVAEETGETYTNDGSTAENGITHTADFSQATDVEDGNYFDVEGANVDSDGDGQLDTTWDINGDPDVMDLDGDGDVDDDDRVIAEGGTEFTGTVDLTGLPADSVIELAAYDSSTPSTRLRITLPDGTVYYIEIIGEDVQILSDIMLTNIESAPTDVTSLWYTPGVTMPASYFIEGYDPATDGNTNETYVNMSDADNDYTLTPSDDDWGGYYEVEFDTGTGDTLNIDLSEFDEDETTIKFETDGDDLLMIITNDDGEQITIRLIGLEYSADTAYGDFINITGGTITENSYTVLGHYTVPGAQDSDPNLVGALESMITQDEVAVDAYRIPTYNTSDYDNELTLTLEGKDFAKELETTINFDDPNNPDTLILNLPSDAVVTFEEDADGNLVLSIETSEGTVKITCVGIEYSEDIESSDTIQINGGSFGDSDASWSVIMDNGPKDEDGNEVTYGYFDIIFYNGDVLGDLLWG